MRVPIPSSNGRSGTRHCLDRLEGGGGSGLDTKFLVDVPKVNSHHLVAHPENGADVGVGFPLRHPEQHFRLARDEPSDSIG